MANKSRLGRGLEALIPETLSEGFPSGERLFEVEIRRVHPNPYQPRTSTDSKKLEELAQSIKENGVIQPILVRRTAENYEIIAGERRLLAAEMAGFDRIPAILLENIPKEKMIELALVENLQRVDLNPIEAANAYRRLLEECGLSHSQMAEKLGKDRSSVTNTLRLLSLPPEVQQFLKAGQLSEGHGRALLSLEDRRRSVDLANRAIELCWSVRTLEEEIQRGARRLILRKKKPKRARVSRYADLEEELRKLLGTRVAIDSKKKGGRIVIDYYSEEDLTRILEIINVQL
jgi:ParB family chromosome partitioning protein